jgi:hypothetical protein
LALPYSRSAGRATASVGGNGDTPDSKPLRNTHVGGSCPGDRAAREAYPWHWCPERRRPRREPWFKLQHTDANCRLGGEVWVLLAGCRGDLKAPTRDGAQQDRSRY